MTERFRIKKSYQGSPYEFDPVFKADTTKECYDFLIKQLDLDVNEYYVEDLEDDIFVWSDEFIQAFKEGECPADLQFF